MIVLTQFATAVGGGVLVVVTSASRMTWRACFFYPFFVFIGFLPDHDRPVAARARISTVPDILQRLYARNPLIVVLAAIASIVVPFGWLATQFVAFASLFSEISGLSTLWLTVIMAAITLVFVLPGGLRSVAWSDFLFGVLMLIMSVVIAGYVLNMAGGWSGITEAVPADVASLPSGLGAAGASAVVLWLFAIVPGTLTNQLYYQRIFSIRDIAQARKSLIISGALVLVSGAYAFIIGMSARALRPGLADPEMAAGWILTHIPTVLLAIHGAFLMATIVSTTGSALQSVVANAVQDVYLQVMRRQRTRPRWPVPVVVCRCDRAGRNPGHRLPDRSDLAGRDLRLLCLRPGGPDLRRLRPIPAPGPAALRHRPGRDRGRAAGLRHRPRGWHRDPVRRVRHHRERGLPADRPPDPGGHAWPGIR